MRDRKTVAEAGELEVLRFLGQMFERRHVRERQRRQKDHNANAVRRSEKSLERVRPGEVFSALRRLGPREFLLSVLLEIAPEDLQRGSSLVV